MDVEGTQAHVTDLVAKLREAADQLEGIGLKKGNNVHQMAVANMEIQSCCGDCLLISGVPCKTCIEVSPLA